MAISNSGFLQNIKGKIDNFIFYKVKGQQRIRSHNPCIRVPPSEAQLLQRKRIRAAVSFYRENKNSVVMQTWRLEAKEQVGSGYNLFLSHNLPAFNQKYQIVDHSKLQISCGKLELPVHFKVADYGADYVTVCWENILPECSARSKDLLQATWLVGNNSFTLQTMLPVPIYRKEKEARLYLPGAGREDIHLYLYFSEEHQDGFSPDKYFYLKKR